MDYWQLPFSLNVLFALVGYIKSYLSHLTFSYQQNRKKFSASHWGQKGMFVPLGENNVTVVQTDCSPAGNPLLHEMQYT